jgi:MFS family permease
MVERGQPLGLTGRIQSIQWAAMYGATILIGPIGGWLSEHDVQMVGLAICSAATGVLLVVTIMFVREPQRAKFEPPNVALRELWQAVRQPAVVVAAAFLFLWNFNPFSQNIQYLHMVNELKFSEQFVGNLTSVFAVAALVASVAYGFYCRALPLHWLIHISIAMGVLSTLGYWAMHDATSAVIVTLIVGASYMTGMLITLDLVARACPVHVAATMFALFMSLSNFSYSLSELASGPMYDWMIARGNATIAYNVLVGVGAAFTAACWLLLPWLNERTFKPEEKV